MAVRPDRASMPHLMSLLAAFVAVSVAMGVLAAGLLMPAVGAAGSLSNKSINAFDNIDKTWTTTALAQQSKILDADNKVIATPYDQNRIIVKLSKVAPIMQQAQVAIEDSRFFDHGALDIRGTARAFFNNAAGNSTQGGSSLTQQFVKMTLQYEALKKGDEQAALDAIDVNYGRKLREMALAMQVEKEMTKRQILQGYLNLAYYGDQAYGIEAAALHYFDVHASQLNLTQSATLAGVVQSPSNSDPHNYPEAAQKRRDVVLDRMAQLGIISAAESAAAKKPSIKSLLRIRDSEGGTCDRSSQPYFCNYVIAYLKTLKVLGKNEDERTLAINRGGLTIKTTIKSDWQQQILVDLRSRVPAGDPSGIGAAAAVVEPGTGKVLAMVQTSEYGLTKDKKSSVAKTTQSWVVPIAYGGTLGFPIGSTAKVFTLLTGLESGIPVNGTVPAPAAGIGLRNAHAFPPTVYKDGCGSPDTWYVSNDFQTKGPTETFRYATAQSINSAFAATMISLGGCKVRDMWNRLGAVDGNGKEVYPTPSNLTLGSASVAPLTLANVYATLAADGKWCPTTPIESIKTADGKFLKLPAPKCKQVLQPDIVAGADELLKGVIATGTGTAAAIGRPAAGKTGTHEGHQQSWFVGYTPQLATAVYVGTPITAHEMDGAGACVGGRCYGHIFGGTIAAPLWGQIMGQITQGMPYQNFPAPSYKILNGDLVSVPYVVGRSVGDATAILQAAGFSAVVGGTVQSTVPAGLVGATAPTGSAARGTTITLLTSTGYVPPPVTQKPPPNTATTPANTATKPANTATKPPGNTLTSQKP
ncbi:MAG TPA: transglycosylase domain-containing protein [Tetrasphaera sp.]|uniref:transglycosylase domain-containing protein n=1 Tax=Nostocoides sp. TaxID=1917966 RepID=UPI002CC501AB|nr:transglycosylase domain-containing protein [Tetrasphaera sp.]HNQ07263.1 transglycosylase domain-containing protein [Tetrasphaera sp.]